MRPVLPLLVALAVIAVACVASQEAVLSEKQEVDRKSLRNGRARAFPCATNLLALV